MNYLGTYQGIASVEMEILNSQKHTTLAERQANNQEDQNTRHRFLPGVPPLFPEKRGAAAAPRELESMVIPAKPATF